MSETKYCEPDTSRGGDPCRFCGTPAAQMGLGDGLYGHMNAKPCPARSDAREAFDLAERGERGEWINTFTGRKVYPLAPTPDMLCIEDIAHALAHQCRYTGHTSEIYSVAEHSVRVSRLAEQWAFPDERQLAACWGLMHDASEAYLVDVARPVKRSAIMAGYREAERRLMSAICEAFGLPQVEPAVVKRADRVVGVTEARDLLPVIHPDWKWQDEPLPERITPLSPLDAKLAFLGRYAELWGGL